MSRYQIKNKKYALRKIGKYVGSVVIGLALMGFVNIPKVQASASDFDYGEYTVVIKSGRKYQANPNKEYNVKDYETPINEEDVQDGSQSVSKKEDSKYVDPDDHEIPNVAGAEDYSVNIHSNT